MHQFGLELISSYFPYLGQREGLNPALVALGQGETHLNNLEKMIQKKGYVISPITDNSPFFYKIEKGIPHSVALVLGSSIIILLLMVLAPSILWKKGLIQAKARSKNQERFNQTKIKSFVLFSMLGFGFILIEISLIQRFVIFLGHPVLSMAVLLFGLLGAAGIGSILSGRLTSDKINVGISVASLSVAINTRVEKRRFMG